MNDENKTVVPEATPEEAKAETPKAPPKAPKTPPKPKVAIAPTNFTIPLKDIILPKHWNREAAGNLTSLITSMKTLGQLVALTVRPAEKEGQYILTDGRRRYMAMKEAGIKEAFVTFTSGDDTHATLEGIVVNLNREGNTAIESAMVFKELLDSGMANQDIAKACGVSGAYVSQHVNLLNLPVPAQEAVRKGFLSLSQCRALVRLDLSKENHVEKFEKAYEKAINGTSATDLDMYVQAFLDKEKAKVHAEKAKEDAKNPKKTKKAEKEEPTRGRPVKIKDYTELKTQINPVNKTTLFDYLQANSERLAKTTSDLNRHYLKGVRDGLELAAGLRE
jgi:ParB/RepB/Spo0J family partition protein